MVKQENNSSPWADGEKMCDKVAQPPFPVSLSLLGEEVELDRRKGWGKAVFKGLFYFLLPCTDFVSNKFD